MEDLSVVILLKSTMQHMQVGYLVQTQGPLSSCSVRAPQSILLLLEGKALFL